MIDKETLRLLIQFGMGGITLALLWYMDRKEKRWDKTLTNHLRHDEEAKREVAAALDGLKEAIQDDFKEMIGELRRYLEKLNGKK